MARVVLGIVAALVVALSVYGLVVYVDETQRLGGDALNGYVQGDHYYVGNHGRYTEVTAEQWELSRGHAIRMFVMQPLALLAMGFLVLGVIVPSTVGRPSSEARERVHKLVTSGPLLGSARCRARIGRAKLPVRVAVHPAGIVVHPMWMQERAIASAEISAVRKREGLFVAGLEIEHRGVDLASPILLRLDASSPVATAILGWNPSGLAAAR
jgi:hypothetical protein